MYDNYLQHKNGMQPTALRAAADANRPTSEPTMENVKIELTGRHRLIGELLDAGLHAANPVFDTGVDLIAYSTGTEPFAARPIQLKASSKEAFAVHQKYANIPGLIMAYVWHVGNPSKAATYALEYRAAEEIADRLGWTTTSTWRDKHHYVSNRPSQEVKRELEPHRMDQQRWRRLIADTEV